MRLATGCSKLISDKLGFRTTSLVILLFILPTLAHVNGSRHVCKMSLAALPPNHTECVLNVLGE